MTEKTARKIPAQNSGFLGSGIKVWSWKDAVRKAHLEPNTKFVLLNLSLYMNEVGQSCFPSIDQQAEDTGLNRATVMRHLQKAVEAGFLVKRLHGYRGRKWGRNEYEARYPDAPDNPCEAVASDNSCEAVAPCNRLEGGGGRTMQPEAVAPCDSISPENLTNTPPLSPPRGEKPEIENSEKGFSRMDSDGWIGTGPPWWGEGMRIIRLRRSAYQALAQRFPGLDLDAELLAQENYLAHAPPRMQNRWRAFLWDELTRWLDIRQKQARLKNQKRNEAS